MKKIITLAILSFSIASYAQGNLQFNKVRTYTGGYNTNKIFDTVPLGKVWKIESIGISGGKDIGGNNTGNLTVNGIYYNNVTKEKEYSSNYNSLGVATAVIKETIWLKSGDILGWAGGGPCVVSLIEYNIIQ